MFQFEKIRYDFYVWVNNSNLPILLTTVKAKLYLFVFLLITLIVLLYYAFGSLTPEYRETIICIDKSKSLMFREFDIFLDLEENCVSFNFIPNNAFESIKATNDSLVFYKRNELYSDILPEFAISCKNIYYSNSDSSFYKYGYLHLDFHNTTDFFIKDYDAKRVRNSECGNRFVYQRADNLSFVYELERYYFPRFGWCDYFEREVIDCHGDEIFAPNGNPYVLYQLSLESFENNDFDSDNFTIAMLYKSGSMVINNIFPEPSFVTSKAIIFKGKQKIDEIIRNNGVYFYLQNLEKVKWFSRFQNLASLLSGAILAWMIDLIVSIILIWKELIKCD